MAEVSEAKGKILEKINSSDDEQSVKDLCQKLDYAYSTVLKWVEVLLAEEKIIVRDFGNIKLVKRKDK
jgi:hypothetical protein